MKKNTMKQLSTLGQSIWPDNITRGLPTSNTLRRYSEALSFELVLEDLIQAANLLRPIYDATSGVDGWVSLEVSPLRAEDMAATVKAAVELHGRAKRPNLFIKIPSTRQGSSTSEETILTDEPVNVPSLFVSRWDIAVKGKVPVQLRNRLGIAVAKLTVKAYHELLTSSRCQKLAMAGA